MNREAIYSGFFAQLQAIPGVKTCSRKLQHWTDVPSEFHPAIFLAQGNEFVEPANGFPSKVTLRPTVYLYANTAGADNPGAVLNPLLDAIEAIINARHPVTGRNSLGMPQAVEWARIDGQIDTDEGVLGDQAVAQSPVAILTTD
jgi:hypothetical protein